MSRYLSEIEDILRQSMAEHLALVVLLDAQQKAMSTFDLPGMRDAAAAQEAVRQRLVVLDHRRRVMLSNLARELRVAEPLTLRQIAALLPPRAPGLMRLRAELREAMDAVASRTQIGSRLAGAVLGHINTVFRLFSTAAGKAGVYTKSGIPRVPGRIGIMEAVA